MAQQKTGLAEESRVLVLQKMQPYYYITLLACLFVIAGVALFVLQLWPVAESGGITIEPGRHDEVGALYDLWFSSDVILDLSVDHALEGILFSTESGTVSLLDRERKLRWDQVFEALPSQARLSNCGEFAAIGTIAGSLHFVSADLTTRWTAEGAPISLVSLSPNASWVAVVRRPQEEPEESTLNTLELYDREGRRQWSAERGQVLSLNLNSEYLDQANIFLTTLKDEEPTVEAISFAGDSLWSKPGRTLSAVSRHGTRLATLADRQLAVYDSMGQSLWNRNMPFEVKNVLFNPHNYNRLLVYGSREGAADNLYYYDLNEGLLWRNSIADGSLLSFTADGEYIITSSWRHFKEDYTQMNLINRDGHVINSWEVAMRVERLVVSGHPHLAVISGEDGYIDLINLAPLLDGNGGRTADSQVYNPVAVGSFTTDTVITLYFIDEGGNLVPVSRAVPQTDDPLSAALEELVLGPVRGSTLYRTIPDKDISIDYDFESHTGTLVLDLSSELLQENGLAQSVPMIDSLYLTASAHPAVETIFIYANGELLTEYGNGFALEQPLQAHRWQNPVYIPVMSGNRYYLTIMEALGEPGTPLDLLATLSRTVHRLRALPFVSADLELRGVTETADRVVLDLSSHMQEIFHEEVDEQAVHQAALILDALFLTVFENSSAQRVEIIIEGEPWVGPSGYPALKRFLRLPYYINPES